MTPQSPVVKGSEDLEAVYAKDQPEYLPLPALPVDDGTRIITRWKLTLRERVRLLLTGDLYLQVLTFRRPLQPVALSVEAPVLQKQ